MISILVIVWAVVVALDAASTGEGLGRGLREANRLLRWLMGKMGESGLWVGAMVLGAVVVGCIVGLYEWHPWAGYLFGAAAIVWRGVVVYKNFRLIGAKR
jgi:hypothetical protein